MLAAALGVLSGVVQVAAAAAAIGHGAGAGAGAGLLYAALSSGSLLGTAAWGAHHWRWPAAQRLAVVFATASALVAGCAAITSLPGLAVVLLVVGACLGPISVTCFELADRLTPPGALVEAVTTTTAAALAGAAAGTATGGVLVDRAGITGTFLTGSAVAAISALFTLTRRRTLPATPRHVQSPK